MQKFSSLRFVTGLCLALAPCLASGAFPSAVQAQQLLTQDSMSARDFYKTCKSAKSDTSDQLSLCYLDSFVELRKSGDVSGKCAPGLIGLLSQPHTHFMRLRETLKETKPADSEDLKAYQQRILSATYPCS